jgi:Ca2+-binding RTX toxin-like protein
MMSLYLFRRLAVAAGCCALLALAAAARPDDAAAAACTITSNDAVIVGTSQSDVICGGAGDNVIYGGLLDDEIYGGGGNDVLIGGHGTDLLHGQTGNDVLRGGTNRDCYVGGDGIDTVSFASMTPSGRDGNGNPSTAGVTVHLKAGSFPAERSCPDSFTAEGLANGEGADEDLIGVENVVGSAFDDDLEAANNGSNDLRGGGGNDVLRGRSSGAADDTLRGEAGTDQCRNNDVVVACADAPEGAPRPAAPHAYVESRGADSGVVVLGRLGNDPDTLAITRPSSTQVRIDFDEAPTATASCPKTGTLTLTCTISTPRYVTAWGDFGNDTMSIGTSGTLFPLEASLDVNGGPGDDIVTGGPNQEILFTGEGGADQLYGNAGTDALISEGDPVGSGGDYLAGGDGNDQLVTDNACAGHTLWGGNDTGSGAGGDIIGFARQQTLLLPGNPRGVWAQLGSGATAGDAYAIPEPGGCVHSQILGGGEILEGTNQLDQLRGNDAPNEIWGRRGNDTIFGLGGNDILHGHDDNDVVYGNEGNDTVYGEAGVDELYGGDGSDKLRSQDNRTDTAVNCGAGADYAVEADPNDPVVSCNELG